MYVHSCVFFWWGHVTVCDVICITHPITRVEIIGTSSEYLVCFSFRDTNLFVISLVQWLPVGWKPLSFGDISSPFVWLI